MSSKENLKKKLQALGYFGHSVEDGMRSSDVKVIDEVITNQECEVEDLNAEIAFLRKEIAEKKLSIRKLKRRRQENE